MDDRIRRIELVTLRYDQMQGLLLVWIGAMFAAWGNPDRRLATATVRE